MTPYGWRIVEFLPGGRVITTTTMLDGLLVAFIERYRVVGRTLIVNRRVFLINAGSESRRTSSSLMASVFVRIFGVCVRTDQRTRFTGNRKLNRVRRHRHGATHECN
jgi:hypothetical protein